MSAWNASSCVIGLPSAVAADLARLYPNDTPRAAFRCTPAPPHATTRGDPSRPRRETFMTQDDAFLQTIRENPADAAVRLIYADWLTVRSARGNIRVTPGYEM